VIYLNILCHVLLEENNKEHEQIRIMGSLVRNDTFITQSECETCLVYLFVPVFSYNPLVKGKMACVQNFIWKHEMKKSPQKHERSCKHNIKIDLKGIRYEEVVCVQLPQAVVKTVIFGFIKGW
jgi:hypothetical protein